MTPLSIDEAITCTRASVGYVDNVAGKWFSVAANKPRRSDKGLLVEEARTNVLTNSAVQGAVLGSPGTLPTGWAFASTAGLTQTIVATGVENGVEYVDIRLSGTTTGDNIYLQMNGAHSAGLTAQRWQMSAFCKLVAGSLANVVGFGTIINEYTAALAFIQSDTFGFGASVPTSTLTRYVSSTLTSGGATTAYLLPYLWFPVTNGQAVDFTVRIGWPQFELGSFPTSPIRTTTVAVTRAADNNEVNFPELIVDENECTLFCDVTQLYSNAGGALWGTIFGWASDPGIGWHSYVIVVDQSDFPRAEGYSGQPSGIQIQNLLNSTVGTTRFKCAAAAEANNARAALDGVLSTLDSSCMMPVGTPTYLTVGYAPWDWDWFNGYIHKVRCLPRRATDAELQSMTE